MKIQVVLVALALLVATSEASACSDPVEPAFEEQLARARNVFVFRLLSLQIADSAPSSREVVGKIQIIRTLKGNPTFRQITFENVPCGGLHPLVGHYFAAATRQEGLTLDLVPGDNSIIDVHTDYALTRRRIPEEYKFQSHIANYLGGIALPPRFAETARYRTVWRAAPPLPPAQKPERSR